MIRIRAQGSAIRAPGSANKRHHRRGDARPASSGSPEGPVPGRLRPMLAVYALRGLIVWPLSLLVAFVADRLTGCHLDTPEPLRRGSWPHTLVEASPRLPCSSRCCCASHSPSPRPPRPPVPAPARPCAVPWSLTWTRAGAPRVPALAGMIRTGGPKALGTGRAPWRPACRCVARTSAARAPHAASVDGIRARHSSSCGSPRPRSAAPRGPATPRRPMRRGAANADPAWIISSAQRGQFRCLALSWGCLNETRQGRQTYEVFPWLTGSA